MARTLALVSLALCISACGGSDFSTQAGTGGNRSRGSGGATSHSDTTGGTTSTQVVADCEVLWRTYLGALDAARICDPNAGEAACNAEWVLPGTCGCNVLVNANSTAYAEAKAQHEALAQTNCDFAACPCPTHDPELTSPQCRSGGSESSDGLSTCQW